MNTSSHNTTIVQINGIASAVADWVLGAYATLCLYEHSAMFFAHEGACQKHIHQ